MHDPETRSADWPPEGARFQARWIFPVDGEPVENGIVEIAEGRIAALHDRPDPRATSLGHVAIVPQFVNAHTHLEFSDLAEPLQPSDPFTAWIRRLVRHRATREAPSTEVVREGLAESSRVGVGAIGEIATAEWSPEPLDDPDGPRIVAFRELIGLQEPAAAEQLRIARDHLAAPGESSNVIRGLSPHAPYSVHPDLYRQLVDLAVGNGAPVAVHLAETLAELELLRDGRGEFVHMLRDFGVWNADAFSPGTRPLDYLRPLERLERALVVHGNHLDDEELAFLAARPHLAVVFCPRTHHFFGHGSRSSHPWRELLAAGGAVCLGTDSRASNPDLGLWQELLFLRSRFPDHPANCLLELGTICGARALGVDDEYGSLTVGRTANLAVISLGEKLGDEPYSALLRPEHRVVATMSRGRWSRIRR